MKHLKRINEGQTFKELTTLINDILIDVKDDYPLIKGEIIDGNFIPGRNENALLILKLNCDEVKIEGVKGSISYNRNRLTFISTILDACQRIEQALHVEAKIGSALNTFDNWQDANNIRIYFHKK